MSQEWIVGIIVGLAVAYAVWYWLPAGLRAKLGKVNPSLAQAPGCNACASACDGCGSAATPSAPSDDRVRPVQVVRRPPESGG